MMSNVTQPWFTRFTGRLGVLLLAYWVAAGFASAAPVVFDASGLLSAGPKVTFALDFIDGSVVANQVRARSFATDGALSEGTRAGAVTGSLAAGLLLSDTSAFSEALLNLGGASRFSFLFDSSGFAPATGEFGDSLSLFLLGVNGQSLVETSDPTGNNALMLYVIDGSGAGLLQVFSAVTGTGVQWSATPQAVDAGPGVLPEPDSVALVALALLLSMSVTSAVRARWVGTRRGALLGLAALALGGGAHAADLTASVQIVRSGLVLNRSTGTFDAQVTVTNRSADTLLGPLTLALESATPANVALYNSYGRTASGADYVVLPLSGGTLAPGASVSTTVRLLGYGQGVGSTDFSVQGTRLTAANSAQIVVSAVYAAGVVAPVETSVGAGLEVSVDGAVRGVTDTAGRLVLSVPTSARTVAVERPPSQGGSAILPQLVVGSSNSVKVTVDEGKEIGAGSLVRLEQAQQGVLLRSTQTVTLRFFKNEKAVKLSSLDNVNLVDVLGNYSNLGALFTLQADGSASAPGTAFVQALAGKTGRLRLEVGGSDGAGAVHVAAAVFYLADYLVRVQLVAPPSNPTLPLAGVRITTSLLNSDIRFVAQSDASGYIVLPDVPAGSLSFAGGTSAGGAAYLASGSAAINRNSLVRLTLRGPADVLANVSPIFTQLLPANAPRPAGAGPSASAERPYFTAAESARREAADSRARLSAVPKALAASPSLVAPATVTVSVTAAARDVIVQATGQLLVKKGSKKVTLKYTVFTAEYPNYVLVQSVYNDVWSVSVLSQSGVPVFDITQQVNTQLFQAPVWQSNGSTGEIKQEVNVESLAAAADTTLILRATSVNIGDSQLPTIVQATLDATEPLLIGNISPDANSATANDGSYYSIPRSGTSNALQRTFDVEVSKPSGSTLSTVSVELRSGAGGVLQTVLQDVAPGSPGVVVVAEDDTSAKLRVRVTHDVPVSTVASQPPPARDIAYHFTVKATASDGAQLKDEKDASGKRALWRMPDGIGRYGGRDAGGDEWAARGTYNWLVANSGLIREINDISGEHGRNIGHASHGRGTDIDAFHFYRFPGAVSGGQNYAALQTDLLTAFGTLASPAPPAATQAFNRVAAWIAATRAGLTNLTALSTVAQVIHCNGTAAGGVAAGWCSALIRVGTAARAVAGPSGPVTETLTFGGAFSSAKVNYRDDHNDHVHVTLNAGQIGE